MAKVKYYSEDELVQKIQSGEYGWLDFVNHHSRDGWTSMRSLQVTQPGDQQYIRRTVCQLQRQAT